VQAYAYYDATTRGVRFEAMCADLNAAAPGTVVVLHGCCHNPTGCDIEAAQWPQLAALAKGRGLIPIIDFAYQGFADGIAEDGAAIGAFLDAGIEFFVASSFSKNFSLYGERVGALSVVCASADETARVLSQLKIMARTNYSTPPTHGAQIVATVLTTPTLRQQWEGELAAMRERIRTMRKALAAGLDGAGAGLDTGFINRQRGMFSYSGLSAAQMQSLRADFGVYGVDSGRICVAALNQRNLPRVVAAIVAVLKR
jgi:aromatic-amino-acid transaminase